ncbi:cytochrome P450 [Hyaloscypha finlandica]|nr:cytochrome P450 [Hyaloscypha finlandica]
MGISYGMVAGVLLLCYIVWRISSNSGPRLPKGLPIIGARKGDWFPFWQATLRNSLDVKKAALDGYKQYPNQAAILPVAGPGGASFIVLPASETQFVTEQPDSVLNLRAVIIKGLLYRYTVADQFIVSNAAHQHIITTTLTNQIGNMLSALNDETAFCFEQIWGTDTETFRDVGVWDTLGRVVGGVTNRAFVGLPYSRDPALLRAGLNFARCLPLSARFLSFVWEPLRPLASPLFTLPNRIFERRFTNVLLPEIDRRLRHRFDHMNNDKEKYIADKNDFLQWSIEQAIASGDPRMWKPRTLAGRVLLLNLVSIHTSSLTVTNLVLDLISSKAETLDELRNEITSVLAETQGVWTKTAMYKMEKLDSVFRESARLNTLTAVALRRVVVAKDGLTTPSGVHIPCGNFCAVPSLAVLTDAKKYSSPESFDPFRFVDLRREVNSGERLPDHVERSRMSFPATSNDYLAFGNGRQACPGRFFAAAELKLMLAYVLLHYDFEMLPKRPSDTWVGILRIPSPSAKIRVKRRKPSEVPVFRFPTHDVDWT